MGILLALSASCLIMSAYCKIQNASNIHADYWLYGSILLFTMLAWLSAHPVAMILAMLLVVSVIVAQVF